MGRGTSVATLESDSRVELSFSVHVVVFEVLSDALLALLEPPARVDPSVRVDLVELLVEVSRLVLAVVVPEVLSEPVEELSVPKPDGGVKLGLDMSLVVRSKPCLRFFLEVLFGVAIFLLLEPALGVLVATLESASSSDAPTQLSTPRTSFSAP